jgi:hypothetical protein
MSVMVIPCWRTFSPCLLCEVQRSERTCYSYIAELGDLLLHGGDDCVWV